MREAQDTMYCVMCHVQWNYKKINHTFCFYMTHDTSNMTQASLAASTL